MGMGGGAHREGQPLSVYDYETGFGQEGPCNKFVRIE